MKATYAAAATYAFLTSWNAYLQPLVIIQSQKNRTMALFIANLASGYQPDFGLVMMAVVYSHTTYSYSIFCPAKIFRSGSVGLS
jgi:lactose/L-arabinose transport system permease protein